MAGDLNTNEHVFLQDTDGAQSKAPPPEESLQSIHHYGRVNIAVVSEGAEAPRSLSAKSAPKDLTEIEELGLEAFELRDSGAYRTAKENRPRQGEPWDMTGCALVKSPEQAAAKAPGAEAIGHTSEYLEGSVAVGVIIVQGPTPELRFTAAERLKVIAEVQNGLGFYASSNPPAGINFTYDIQNVVLSTPADPDAADLEGLWRDPAMASLGYASGWDGIHAYVEHLRTRFGTRWTYCAYFTKYPLQHFGYAYIGGPYMVMDYNNDGWGPDNIDRVFAHETGHIFGSPDEYDSSGCDCDSRWGRYQIVNANCESCAAGGGVQCLMKGNDFELCNFTPAHLGWSPSLVLRAYGADSGGWKVERHPRMMADVSGDGRADIVGFGNAGAYVSRAQANGRFGAPVLAVHDFGTDSGWLVDKHPRVLADTTGDGKADIVGFGDGGVWVSRAQAGGTFENARRVVGSFGYSAGGWRIEKHPRFLADVTGDGRADIVGFANAGVYVSLARADGTFSAQARSVDEYGYDQSWRVDKHPRLLADTTGDGKADIVGFGDSGVWVSRARGGGNFDPLRRVVDSYGYEAGGWRVEKHLRFLVDVTGDGRADIVGFGNAGVYVSLARTDGTFSAPVLAIREFGYSQSWRVDQHPRLLADTTGDGLPDVVGFGDDGLWVSRNLGGGNFERLRRVDTHYGHASTSGGWRVDRHPRFLADTTGDGKADVVGMANAGVYLKRF